VKTPAALFPIALALGGIILVPWASARAQDTQVGPIEIDTCQTISQPGSYKLVNNLTFTGTTGTCLLITASFVTINLAGFTISGPGTGAIPVAAIAASTQNPAEGEPVGIAVRNGSISGFHIGVSLGDNSIVEELRVVGPGMLGVVGINAMGIVRGNTVRSFGGGASGTGVGISAGGIVTGNFVGVSFMGESNGHGMEIGQGSTVIGNTALDNRVGGITVLCPANVTDNTAIGAPPGSNLVLNGTGCNNTNNVAP
jgi:hypothetical protein